MESNFAFARQRATLACLSAAVAIALPAWSQTPAPSTYTITTVAGSSGTAGFAGDGGAAVSAQLAGCNGLALDSSGNLYIADQFNNRIRKVAKDGTISTVAGNGTAGYKGDSGPATSAELNNPQGVAVDASGNLYIADTSNYVIRKVAGGTITTFAGNNASPGFGGDGGTANGAQLANPSGLVLDSAGNLFIADTSNNVIRKVTAATGIISTVAGNSLFDSGGDGGPATSAELENPEGVAVDAAGNIYIADSNNRRIRKVAVNGIITTVAGNGAFGFAGDGGPATKAELNNPKGIAVDAAGNLFIADSFNNRIRIVSVNGIIQTIAGERAPGYSGDKGPALSAQMHSPSAVVVDSSGNVYVADNQNNAVRLLTPLPPTLSLPAVSAGGVVSAAAFGAFASAAPGSWIEIYGSNLAGTQRAWTAADFNGVTAPTSLDGVQVSIGGLPAAIDYISAGQINAQVPSNAGVGPQPLTVTTAAGTSAAYTLTVNTTQPGLYAPPPFKIGGKQYVGALFSDGTTYVLPPNSVPGYTSRQAHPGEIIILYGVGFGSVTPSIAAGQVVQQSNTLASPIQILFGQTPATTISFSGLAPNAVGLYQFNVVVPAVPASDAVPLTFTLGGVSGTQTLYIAVQN